MTTTDHQQTDNHRAEQLAKLRAIWQSTRRRRDLLAFIRSCPREDWVVLAEEYDRLANRPHSFEDLTVPYRRPLVS